MDFDKQIIAENFSKSSRNYNKWAEAQKLIALRFKEILPELGIDKHILEFGCGTGFLTDLIISKYSELNYTGIDIAEGMIDYCSKKFSAENRNFIAADIESYKFRDKVNLIISSSTLQWCSDIDKLFSVFNESLNENGIFSSTVLVSGSFSEFYNSYKAVTGNSKIDFFFRDSEYYLNALKNNNFKIKYTENYCDLLKYNNAAEAMRSVKNIGAVLDSLPKKIDLTDKLLAEIIKYYNKTYKDSAGNVTLSYNSLYFTGVI